MSKLADVQIEDDCRFPIIDFRLLIEESSKLEDVKMCKLEDVQILKKMAQKNPEGVKLL